ncbi:MAG: flagellar motor stator protein MotA [Pseudomonadota bacterium]|nr:flagellar motor stator protein MotA [Pseudomonadota bacterium]MED5336644.1 flagellar motor stator protein MotA [Pseudomonadota bacterium]MED5518553.1 flagellar motor stator protein MotA [Pseudomonadota bacterium]
MFVIFGWIFVTVCVIGGYMAMGGKLGPLWQPFELVIIGGAGVGAFIVANPKYLLGKAGYGFKAALKGPKYSKEDYLELLGLLYAIFRLAKTKGMLAIESHIERPEDSSLFQAFPKFSTDHHALEFLCDYLRMMTLGTDNPHELADLLDEELETHHAEDAQVAGAFQTMGDGFPALGIVAAVLGVIKTMGSITEPPEVLGKLIGGALVGTFLGILLSYGYVSPLSAAMKATFEADAKYMQCIKVALLAHVSGYAPAVSVEFARKTLMSKDRPSFFEVEEAVAAVPTV